MYFLSDSFPRQSACYVGYWEVTKGTLGEESWLGGAYNKAKESSWGQSQ